MIETCKFLDQNGLTMKVSFLKKKGYKVVLADSEGFTFVGQDPDLFNAWRDACDARFAGYLFRHKEFRKGTSVRREDERAVDVAFQRALTEGEP